MSSLIRFDWALKRLLRNKASFVVLEGFISTIIQEDIKIVEILESESNRKHNTQKQNRVDILCKTTNGELCIIEVQVEYQFDYLMRMLFAASTAVTEYIKKGGDYATIPKVYSINVLYFDPGAGTDCAYKSTNRFLGIYDNKELKLSQEQKEYFKSAKIADDLYPEYWILNVANFNNVAKNSLDEWLYYLKNDKIKDSFTAKGLKEAKEQLDLGLLSKEERQQYKAYETSLHDASSFATTMRLKQEASKKEGREEGREEGILIGEERGIKKGKIEGSIEGKLKNLLSLYLEKLIDLETATTKIKEELGKGYDDLVQEYLAKLGE